MADNTIEEPDGAERQREVLNQRDWEIDLLGKLLRNESEALFKRANEIAATVRYREECRRSLREIEERFRASRTYDGKTVADRDAQLREDLRDDPGWQDATGTLARLDGEITSATLLQEHRERIFKIQMAELRSYGGER